MKLPLLDKIAIFTIIVLVLTAIIVFVGIMETQPEPESVKCDKVILSGKTMICEKSK